MLRGSIDHSPFFCKLYLDMPSEKDIVLSAMKNLNTRGKRLLRFYMTLPDDQFEKHSERMGRLFFDPSTKPSLKNEYQEENKIIQIAYRAKKHNLNAPKAGGKSRRHKKHRGTRKLKL